MRPEVRAAAKNSARKVVTLRSSAGTGASYMTTKVRGTIPTGWCSGSTTRRSGASWSFANTANGHQETS
jgi:hypothetical protein